MGVDHVRVAIVAGWLTLFPVLGASALAQQTVVSANTPVRTSRVAVTVDVKAVSLETALQAIAREAGLNVVFSVAVTECPTRVTMNVRNMSVEEAFARALAGTKLRATIVKDDVLFEEQSGASALVVQGAISGKVIDGKSRLGLRGATVSLSGTGAQGVQPRTMTSDDGGFRFSGVVPGPYTIQVRMVGYVKTTKTVTVADGQTTSIEIGMERSVNALDQVVVTGTVAATAQREVPNAMTIITAKELEERGITTITQLFRGDVPGLFAQNSGSSSTHDEVVMFSRGATRMYGNDFSSLLTQSNSGGDTNPIKTYIDGVELADPRYLAQIDPRSIERIEIVTGPQASTVYGSNAMNGVMQIFTKRGAASRPQITATLLSGLVENDASPATTPQHAYTAQIQGTEARITYSAGGGWDHIGPWVPSKRTTRTSAFGGVHLNGDWYAADASIRLGQYLNLQTGPSSQKSIERIVSGRFRRQAVTQAIGIARNRVASQTLGFTLSVTPSPWWSNEVVLGADVATITDQRTPTRYSPADSTFYLTQAPTSKTSVRYSTTVTGPITSVVKGTATVGADGWTSANSSQAGATAVLTGTLTSAPTITRQLGRNRGAFFQGQLGFADAFFVTYGIRAEWNRDFGAGANPNLAPRYGAAWTHDMETPLGSITAKIRGSYGRATRPPAAGEKLATTATDVFQSIASIYTSSYGNFNYYLSSPDLGPEFQQGGEGGVELYFGRTASLVVTRYNQTVDNVILAPQTDSAKSIVKFPTTYTSLDADGFGYTAQYQFLNVGSIRNQGWELQGTLNAGPFAVRGTISYTKSRVIGVADKYRSILAGTRYQKGAPFNLLPEHTGALGVTYAKGATTATVNVSAVGSLLRTVNLIVYDIQQSRLDLYKPRMALWNGYVNPNHGYGMVDLNLSQRFSRNVEGLLQVQNLGDTYENDNAGNATAIGRQSKLGLRLRL